MIIGSHVSMSAPNFVLGAVKEALSYHANALMLYTGAPQNTKRRPIEQLKIKEAHQLMQENGIAKEHIIVHAPYIINLANCTKPETFELGVDFLKQEIERVKQLEATVLVLHPGSHVKAGEDLGLDKIVDGLNQAMEDMGDVCIALETMAGKGSEIGYTFSHLKYIIDHVNHPESIKVCMDTCHLHDAGYDLNKFDEVLEEFDKLIGIDKIACIHVNDSKNIQGARKDRHQNIGFGEIGFDALNYVVHHPKLEHVVKILETPYVDGNPPYKYEIEMFKNNEFQPDLLDIIKEGK